MKRSIAGGARRREEEEHSRGGGGEESPRHQNFKLICTPEDRWSDFKGSKEFGA